jgi:dipeptidyl-peptidase 4
MLKAFLAHPRLALPLIALALVSSSPVASAQAASDTPKPSAQFMQMLHAWLEQGEYRAQSPSESEWLDDGDRYTILEDSPSQSGAVDLVAYDTATGKRSILVPAGKLIPSGQSAPLRIEHYQWSGDHNQLLIFTNTQKVWRLHTRGDYWVLRLSDGRLTKLGADAPPASLMFAKFSPDGHSVAYVRDNNLYVEDIAGGKVLQLTHDGSAEIINGTTDWVTEEEFGLRDAFRWSPDSVSIAYWQFDQSGVGDYTLINDTNAPYPTTFHYRYPHPGGTNAAVRVGVVSAQGGPTQWIDIPGDPRNQYIPRMDWIGDSNELILENLNRLQNTNRVLIANAGSGQTRLLFEDKDPAWVEVMPEFQWLSAPGSAGSSAPHNKTDLLCLSERDGWRHAYLISRATGQARLITNFPADVIQPVLLDEPHGFFYFIASPNDPIRHYLYRSRLDGTGTPQRVTPENLPGSNGYNASPNGKWAIHIYSSASHPTRYDLVRLDSHQVVRTLVTNDGLLAKENAIDPEPIEFTETPVTDGAKLSTFIVKPPNFDPTKKYPMLVYVYSEPASCTVHDAWAFTFDKAIAREGYVVVSFDNEGTPAPRGRAWRTTIYGRVGLLNSEEQSQAIGAFEQTHAYIDSHRVGMWGHSGGGSATLNEMFRHPGQVQAAVASSPVADEALYDTIYQERYMGLPSGNAKGYHDGSPISFAEGLSGHLLVIHGSGDDNVHFQGTEMLVNRLIALGKQFDFMDYPNRTHALSEGPGTSVHVNALRLRYLEEYIPPGPR